jgi:hypothetical protein
LYSTESSHIQKLQHSEPKEAGKLMSVVMKQAVGSEERKEMGIVLFYTH